MSLHLVCGVVISEYLFFICIWTGGGGNVRRSLRCAGGGLPVSRCEGFPSDREGWRSKDLRPGIMYAGWLVGPREEEITGSADARPSPFRQQIASFSTTRVGIQIPRIQLEHAAHVAHALPSLLTTAFFPVPSRSFSSSPLLVLTQRWVILPVSRIPYKPLSLPDPHPLASQPRWPPPLPHPLHPRRPSVSRFAARNPSASQLSLSPKKAHTVTTLTALFPTHQTLQTTIPATTTPSLPPRP